MTAKNVKKDILLRIWVSFVMVGLIAVAILFQMIRLQTIKRPYLQAMGDSTSRRYDKITPIRGNIYAADGGLLATSVPFYEARMDMRVYNADSFKVKVDSLAWCLSTYFKDKSKAQYKQELIQARRNKEAYYLIRRKLSHSQIKDIRKFPIIRLSRNKGGFISVQKSRRIQPFGQLCMRTIGLVRDDVQTVGLEGAYDQYLAGKTGWRLVQKTSGGVWAPINDENELDPKDGQDVYTTLDINFQDITHIALERALQDKSAEHGCAVVMEVATGHIKAIANLTRESDGTYTEKYNYAIGASTEPGSTMKLASVLALLEHKKATPGTVIDVSGGQTEYFGKAMRDSKGGHTAVTLEEGFAISSNVAISKAVYQAYSRNPAPFSEYVSKNLHFGQPLDIHIAGEGIPVVKSPRHKDWSGITLPWMSVGYEVQVTPLQMLTLYNAVANGGVMVKPQFVTEVREVGQPIRKFETEILNKQICSPQTLQQVQRMLEEVVESGTAENIKNDLYKIAGKTGTAQIADQNDGYHKKKVYQSSFAGYFPANKPTYSIIVVISEPKGEYYGSMVAAPVFKEIADKIYARTATAHSYLASFEKGTVEQFPLTPTINQAHLSGIMELYDNKQAMQVEPDAKAWVKPEQKNGKMILAATGIKSNTVPNVTGMSLADALFLLENNGLRVRFSGKGKVISQSLQAGTPFTQGQIILIQLG